MARNEPKTYEQQNQQARERSQQNAVATGNPQQRGMARRSFDPTAMPFGLLGLNPFALMGRLMEQLDYAPRRGENGESVAWAPAIEVAERDGNLAVRVDLPGLQPDEVRVAVLDDALVVEGESTFQREDDKGGIHRTERRYGRFMRTIPLPAGAKTDQATARLENGVLEIIVPVQEQQSDRKQIPVQGSSTSQGGSAGTGGASGTSQSSGGSSGQTSGASSEQGSTRNK
jgi:HSP20 family protein